LTNGKLYIMPRFHFTSRNRVSHSRLLSDVNTFVVIALITKL